MSTLRCRFLRDRDCLGIRQLSWLYRSGHSWSHSGIRRRPHHLPARRPCGFHLLYLPRQGEAYGGIPTRLRKQSWAFWATTSFSHFGKESRTETVHPGIRREHLAQMVGTTRSRVNHFMNKFRTLGFIDYTGNGVLTVSNGLLSVILGE